MYSTRPKLDFAVGDEASSRLPAVQTLGSAAPVQPMPAHLGSRPVSKSEVQRSPRLQAISQAFKRDFAAMHRGSPSQQRQSSSRSARRSSSSHCSQTQSSAHRTVNQAIPADLQAHLQTTNATPVPAPIPIQILQSTGESFCGLAPAELEAGKLDLATRVPHDDTPDA